MIRRTFRVTYQPENAQSESVEVADVVDVLPLDMLTVERQAAPGRAMGALEETYRSVFVALCRTAAPGLSPAAAGFDAWLAGVASIERVRQVDLDPTPAADGPPP